MQTAINSEDLGRLARLSCAVVHSIDFPEVGATRNASNLLLGEVDRLDRKYQNDSLLFDIRAAVLRKPRKKHAIYTLTHDLLRKFNNGQDRAVPSLAIAPPYSGSREASPI